MMKTKRKQMLLQLYDHTGFERKLEALALRAQGPIADAALMIYARMTCFYLQTNEQTYREDILRRERKPLLRLEED